MRMPDTPKFLTSPSMTGSKAMPEPVSGQYDTTTGTPPTTSFTIS